MEVKFTVITTTFILITLNVLQSKSYQCDYGAWPPSEVDRVNEVTVNLDLPAEQRWLSIIIERKDPLLRFLEIMKQHFADVFHIKAPSFTLMEEFLKRKFHPVIPELYINEIVGISKVLDIHESYVILLNIIYDVFALCTTSIQYDSIADDVIQVRNLDFGSMFGFDVDNHRWLIQEYLQPLLMSVNFTSQGKTVFRSISYAGSVGVLTGMRPFGLAISINARFALDAGIFGIIEMLYTDNKNQSFTTLCIRDVLQNPNLDYKAAVRALSTTNLISPVYFSVSGTQSDEACIIARSRKRVADKWDIKSKSNNLREKLLVQTNFDRNTVPPLYDDRVTPVYHCVQHCPRNLTLVASLYTALSTFPVANIMTVYTAIMAANSNYFVAYKRNFTE